VSNTYPSPVAELLTLGIPEFGGGGWLGYPEMGLTAADVPELIRMVTDAGLPEGAAGVPASWGPVHAWRALGQLGAAEAVPALVSLLRAGDDEDDWALEDLPRVLGMIGPAALEPVRAALVDEARDDHLWIAAALASALKEMAERHPATRDAAVAALRRQLVWWARQDDMLNAFLINDLVRLNAVEALPEIEAAFAADAVDLTVIDLEEVQVRFGILPERSTPPPPHPLLYWRSRSAAVPVSPSQAGAGVREKRRRKAAKASRKRNRKRR
jgi:hypothetical protein